MSRSAWAELTYGASPTKASGHRQRVQRGRDALLGEPFVGRPLDRRDVEAVLAGELEVPLIAARHRHDRPGAVAHQDVVGDPDRDVLARHRVRGVAAGEHAGLHPGLVLPLEVLAAGGLTLVLEHGGRLFTDREIGDHRVLRRQHHERGPEERVWTGREHLDGAGRRREEDPCTRGATDPVALHGLQRVGPLEHVQIVDQAIGIGRDPHHPLAHVALEDREVAAIAAPVGGDLLVGDDRAQAWAPVDRRIGHVGQAVRVDDVGLLAGGQARPAAPVVELAHAGVELRTQLGDRASASDASVGTHGLRVVPRLEDLGEDPLGPSVVGRIGRVDRAPGVVTQPEPADLAAVRDDVVGGRDRRMRAGLHGELLGRQAEGVEAHRVQHVAAGHPLVADVDVGPREPQRVPDVQTRCPTGRGTCPGRTASVRGRQRRRDRPADRPGSATRTCPRRPSGPASALRSPAPARPCNGTRGLVVGRRRSRVAFFRGHSEDPAYVRAVPHDLSVHCVPRPRRRHCVPRPRRPRWPLPRWRSVARDALAGARSLACHGVALAADSLDSNERVAASLDDGAARGGS